MERVADIIDGLGGNAVISRELKIKPSAVSEMKRRNSIPPKYWLGLIRLSDRAGKRRVTADELVAIHALPDDLDVHLVSGPLCEANDGALAEGRHVTVSRHDLPVAGCR